MRSSEPPISFRDTFYEELATPISEIAAAQEAAAPAFALVPNDKPLTLNRAGD
jgi:hypothetical protein